MDRREFTRRALIAAAAGLSSPFELNAAPRAKLKAIAFDAFALLDPRPIFSLAESLYPGKGMELSNAWRTRQFEY
jgi:2-haloacid dehalogenase